MSEKRAPVQGYSAGIPWSLHLEAYDAYCRKYRPQPELIQGGCRGGFGVEELDQFVPGWRQRVDALTTERTARETAEATVARLKPDARLGQRLEQWVVMNTHFTGEPPYVGDDGLVLALDEMKATVARLREECEALKADAERYRFLRANATEIVWLDSGGGLWAFSDLKYADDDREEMDASIDDQLRALLEGGASA